MPGRQLIAVVDYGMGNLRSVSKALEHAARDHAQVVVTSDASVVDRADRVVFPGQGAMPDCMHHLAHSGLVGAVRRAAAEKPLFGVCVGMQMLFDASDEIRGSAAKGGAAASAIASTAGATATATATGGATATAAASAKASATATPTPTPGLGLLPGHVRRFDAQRMRALHLKVPHMGWNQVHQRHSHPLWAGIPQDDHFYFVHSYHVVCAATAEDTLSAATTEYGLAFTCAVARANIFATQFHPEKSAASGLRLYENFIHWNP